MTYPAGKEIELMVSAVVAETFVKVTVLTALGEPAATLPKLNDDGETVAGATPVPVSVADKAVVLYDVVTAIVLAASAPSAEGVKVTRIVQVAFFANVWLTAHAVEGGGDTNA
jgi:hypothetical protein